MEGIGSGCLADLNRVLEGIDESLVSKAVGSAARVNQHGDGLGSIIGLCGEEGSAD